METFDDKSEGKRSIHRPKTMFTLWPYHLEKNYEISM